VWIEGGAASHASLSFDATGRRRLVGSVEYVWDRISCRGVVNGPTRAVLQC
jgi:hypothetical protein